MNGDYAGLENQLCRVWKYIMVVFRIEFFLSLQRQYILFQ